MGTVLTQKVYGKNAEEAAAAVLSKLKQLENEMSFFKESSAISKINLLSGKESVHVSEDILEVLLLAKKYGKLSEGTFDITIAPVVKSWGIMTPQQKIPQLSKINNLLNLVNYNDIKVDQKNAQVKLKQTGQMIDLGGIAKGYAADKAVQIYKEKGIESAMINLGGNVIGLGTKQGRSNWKVGIQNPCGSINDYLGIVSIQDKTVVTSGAYQRFFVYDNSTYHHIIDPKTGYPAKTDLLSSTIISNTSTKADALSTAMFIMGLEKSIKMLSTLPTSAAILVTKDKNIYVSKKLRDSFVPKDVNYNILWF